MSMQAEFTDNSKVMSRSCSHHAAPSKENLDINGNDKLQGVMEDEDLEPETDGYVGDSEMGEETDDVHVDVTPSTPVPNETLTPSDVQHHQRPDERVRPPSRADSTFLTKTKQEPSRENTQVLGSRSNRSDIPEAVSRGLHRSDNTRVLSSRSSNSLRPGSRAVSSTIAPSVGSRKMVSRASRKSRPHSSGSHGDRGQSSGSESETERRTDATSVSEIEFGGVDISDEKAWDTDLEMEESREVYDHTGRSAYIECCKRLGVIPASYFLRHMTDSHLDMKHHGLGVPGVKAVAVALVSNPHVTRLNLQDNWLGTEGGVAVCDMLRENCFISDLNLSDNKLGLDFVPMITDVVLNAGNLTHLTLSGNNFDDSTGASFAELIMNTRQLEYLNLSSNKLGEEAGAALGAAISENSSLKHLDLSWNCLRRKGAVCVAMGVKTNVFMKQLNLSWNGFGVEGALALGDALKGNSVLQELDITNNRITAEGAVWIGKGLALNETLKTLKMATNPMESPGCFAILASVLRNPSSVVEFLDFNDIQVNRDFHEILQQCQAAFPQLKVIHGGSELLKKPKIKLHPMIKLRNYIEKHNLRMIDFFNKFDKDGSLNVSREEFVMGLEDTGIQLNEEEVEILVSEMDKDGDGEINYSELVIGQRDFMEREERLQKASVASY